MSLIMLERVLFMCESSIIRLSTFEIAAPDEMETMTVLEFPRIERVGNRMTCLVDGVSHAPQQKEESWTMSRSVAQWQAAMKQGLA